MLGEVGQKRDHVVMRLTLYLVDALDLESAALSDGVGRTLGDHAECGLSMQAWASISNQILYRFSGDQIRVISGRL